MLSCKSRQPTIPMDKMVDIFVDIGVAEQVMLLHLPDKRDSVRAVLKESILKVHDISEDEIEVNLELYTTDLERFDELLKRVEKKTESLSETN